LRVAERATLARPYAKAAFEYARDAKTLEQWSAGLNVAAQVMSDPKANSLRTNPGVSVDQMVALIGDVVVGARNRAGATMAGATGTAAAMDAPLENFVRLLAQNRRLGLLPDIAARYEILRAEFENSVDVEVTSAIALSKEQEAKMVEALRTRLKRAVRLKNSLDPSLLGGAIIRAGDLVIDGSLKGRLERLGSELGT
jgi:F-type H+-transporting ATPase subunit delta